MTWVLPQELTDQIIESCWDDPRTLRSCALTCRAWLSTSNSHLAAYHAPRKEIRGVADLDLLSRRLSRRESRRFHRNVVELEVHEELKESFAHTIPFRVSGAFLPNLERLSFVSVGQAVRRVPHWHYSVSKHVGLYRRVSRLCFDHCRLPSLETLRRIVFSLPSLQSLALIHTEFLASCTHSVIEDAAILRQHPKVVELQVLRCTFNRPSGLRHLLQWFRLEVAGKLILGIEMVVLSRRDISLLRLSVWQLIIQDTQWILHGLKTRIDRLPNSIRVLLDRNTGVKRPVTQPALNLPGPWRRDQSDAISLCRHAGVHTVQYNLYIGSDYEDLRITICSIANLFAQGIGKNVFAVYVTLNFLESGFLQPNDADPVFLRYLEGVAIRGDLTTVHAIRLIIKAAGPARTSTPVTETVVKIMSRLFSYWGGRGALFVFVK